jgi:uncharacterized protein
MRNDGVSPLESLKRFYAAEERYAASTPQDFSPVAATLHPQIVLYQPESLPYGGEWRGHGGVEAWIKAFTAAWSAVQPRNPVFHQPDDRTLISLVTMRAQARHDGHWIEMPMCQVITFEDGLPIEWRNFAWDTARLNDALGVRREVDATVEKAT